MISVPVYDMNGSKTGEVDIDPAVLGGEVRSALLKQAIVAYLNHQRQWSAKTKGRSQVEGSTRKIYRQKGTGNARMGTIRQPVRRGGGRTFAKRIPGRTLTLPKKMRRLATRSAILAKLESSDVIVLDSISFDVPKTRTMARALSGAGVDRGCVLAMGSVDRNAYLSARNLPKTEVRGVEELTAYEVLRRKKLVLDRPAFDRIAGGQLGVV